MGAAGQQAAGSEALLEAADAGGSSNATGGSEFGHNPSLPEANPGSNEVTEQYNEFEGIYQQSCGGVCACQCRRLSDYAHTDGT